MKRITLILVASLMLFSCKKEEGNGDANSQDLASYIEGDWDIDDIEFKASFNMGFPITIDGEGSNIIGGYSFKSDNTFSYDWSADFLVEIPPVFSETLPIERQGFGTYKVISNELVELDENGIKSNVGVRTSSPNLIWINLEEEMNMDSISIDLELEVVLVK